MLAAVTPYGSLSFYIDGDEILVMNPETLQVSYAKFSEVRNRISSMSYSDYRGTLSYTAFSLYDMFSSEQMTEFALQNIDFNENLFLLDHVTRVHVRHYPSFDGDRTVYVNGVGVCKCRNVEVSYIFRFRDYYIFRLRLSCYGKNSIWWASAAVDKEGNVVDTWVIGECKSPLSIKVDTISGY